MSIPFPLHLYLTKLQMQHVNPRPSLQLLQRLQEQHLRCIPFENIDIVVGQRVSMALADVQHKLLQHDSAPTPPGEEAGVSAGRGGYCFEHNTLMMAALRAIGFVVEPLLARVRWNKDRDVQTTFTHMALRVTWQVCPDVLLRSFVRVVVITSSQSRHAAAG